MKSIMNRHERGFVSARIRNLIVGEERCALGPLDTVPTWWRRRHAGLLSRPLRDRLGFWGI